MRARTTLLLATPAVVAAVSVAVPALAGNSNAPSPGARSHQSAAKAKKSAPKVHCFDTGRGKSKTRVCEVYGPQGARGGRGPRGFVGAHGKRGLAGTTGASGPTGPTGLARAYAVVAVRDGMQLVANLTREFVAVSRASGQEGIYCLTPTASIHPSESPAVVSAESSFSEPGDVGIAVLNAQRSNCAVNEFEVETFKFGEKGPVSTDGVAFSIIVP